MTTRDLSGVTDLFHGYPEIKYTTISISGNKASVSVQLTKKKIRKTNKELSVFDLEKKLFEKLRIFESKGYKVVSEVLKNGPPGSKAVGLKLIADNADKLPILINVSKDFETYLKGVPGTKNVGRSSNDTPGQFIFALKKELMTTAGISASAIYAQIAQNMNGILIGTVEDKGEDMDIRLKSSKFSNDVRLEDILAIPIQVGNTSYKVGEFVDTNLTNATAQVSRTDGKLQITVDADLDLEIDSVGTQAKFQKFADTYTYPNGISFEK